MDFKERVPLGRTGVEVSRMGLASGYGVPAEAIEKAFHEYSINYLFVSPYINLGNMARAVRNLAPGHRDELFIVLARRYLGGFGALRLERFVAISSHDRRLFPKVASGEVRAPADFFHIRYNAVHTGAEQDVFAHLPQENRPGIVIFTATCWRKLLKPKLLPVGERPLTAADCYRFVLSHPDVDVCITAPSTAARMEENLEAMNAGPLDEEEMARIRRIGRHIYVDAPNELMEK